MVVRRMCSLMLFVLIAPTLASANTCVDMFIKSEVSIDNYNEISIDIRETAVKKEDTLGTKNGTALMTGTYGVLGRDVISRVNYKIQNGNLRLTSALTKSEYYGQNVFSEMIRAILVKNPNIQTITVSINGEFYARYAQDLLQSNSPTSALSANPVIMQLALAGFTKISSSIEVPGGTFAPSMLVVMRRIP
ncbi:MAG: hypothetical protein IT287_01355 [Bdellovibrionaceae bacterium]|nr:hypothetical protein [Pseudobdellovibrionaceae bacterium]